MANKSLAKSPEETTVLVTGGAGFIGSHTVVELLDRGYRVVIVDDLSNSSEVAVERVRTIAGLTEDDERLAFYRASILDREALESIFSNHYVDVVIHFAGFKAVGESVVKPLEYYWNNIAGTLVLAEVAREHDCKNIVFSSSATVYGEPEFIPITEDCPKHTPTNPYGQTKTMLEQILTDLYIGDNEWNVVLLRYFNPIGAHESGMIGEDPEGIPNNLLPYVAQVAVGKLKCVGVFGDDYPTPTARACATTFTWSIWRAGHVAALDWMGGKVGTGTPSVSAPSQALRPRTAAAWRGNLQPRNRTGSSVLDVIHAFEKACGHESPYEIKKAAPRGRHRRELRSVRKGAHRARVGCAVRSRPHVRRQLALAIGQPRRLQDRPINPRATAGSQNSPDKSDPEPQRRRCRKAVGNSGIEQASARTALPPKRRRTARINRPSADRQFKPRRHNRAANRESVFASHVGGVFNSPLMSPPMTFNFENTASAVISDRNL